MLTESGGDSRLVTHDRTNIYISLFPGGRSGITQLVEWLRGRDAIPTLCVNNVVSSAHPEQVITLRVVFQVNQGKNEK